MAGLKVTGDVQGLPLGSQVVSALQGRPVANTVPASGQHLVWNGSQWAPGMTASPFSGGPPGNPHKGDIWIATDVDANGTIWQFRYNPASPTANKWEFIGGSPLTFGTTTPPGWNAGNLNVWTQYGGVGTPLAYTAARGGEYALEGWYAAIGNAGAASFVDVAVYGGVQGALSAGASPPASADFNLRTGPEIMGVNAGTTLTIMFFVTSLPSGFRSGGLIITPKRVS